MTRRAAWRWLIPPRELPAVRGAWRPLLGLLWFACLALPLALQLMGAWLYVERATRIDPAFAAVGLTVDSTDRSHWAVLPLNDKDGASPWAGYITSVDGRDVSGLSPLAVAERLKGEGGTVTLVMTDYDTQLPVTRTLTRSEANRKAVYKEDNQVFGVVAAIVDIGVALALIAGACLLRLRRFDQPVAVVFSFALLFLGAIGTTNTWEWLSYPAGETLVDAVWLSLLLVAIPALPSGRYTPSWARWFMVLAPVAGLVIAIPNGPLQLSEMARMVLLAAAFACVVIRFRYTPKGLERQQLKWACLGLASGLILYLLSLVANQIWERPGFVGPVMMVFYFAEYILHRIAFLAMGAGVLVALMNYRLNDADAAIGRSTGYALVTAVIAIVWAFGAAWIDTTLTLVTGSSNPTLATGLSTLAAMAILAPAQNRVLKWMERRFQRALVRLRDLPVRLARLKHHEDPQPVAAAALKAIIDGVNATEAALTDADGTLVLGAHGITPEAVLADFPLEDDARRLGVRYPLRDMDENVGWLLLGPRSDGSSYNGDERRALHSILDPLADAIHLTRRRRDELAALAEVIAAMEARVAQVEAGRRVAKPRTSRAPKASPATVKRPA